ncbi:hypothetical protein DMENIID0001_138020 [Sergentomyia squamirostris]
MKPPQRTCKRPRLEVDEVLSDEEQEVLESVFDDTDADKDFIAKIPKKIRAPKPNLKKRKKTPKKPKKQIIFHEENSEESGKRIRKKRKSRQTRERGSKIPKEKSEFSMTQEMLDKSLAVLRKRMDVSRKNSGTCYASMKNNFRRTYPLMSVNRMLFEMKKCVEQNDWRSFNKYMLHLGSRQSDVHFTPTHIRLCIQGLTFDPVAKKNNLLTAFAEDLHKYLKLDEAITSEELTQKIFSILR